MTQQMPSVVGSRHAYIENMYVPSVFARQITKLHNCLNFKKNQNKMDTILTVYISLWYLKVVQCGTWMPLYICITKRNIGLTQVSHSRKFDRMGAYYCILPEGLMYIPLGPEGYCRPLSASPSPPPIHTNIQTIRRFFVVQGQRSRSNIKKIIVHAITWKIIIGSFKFLLEVTHENGDDLDRFSAFRR